MTKTATMLTSTTANMLTSTTANITEEEEEIEEKKKEEDGEGRREGQNINEMKLIPMQHFVCSPTATTPTSTKSLSQLRKG